MNSLHEIGEIARWFLRGPRILIDENKVFDKFFGTVELAQEAGRSIALFGRNEACVLREATWQRRLDVKTYELNEFVCLSVGIRYFELEQPAKELIRVVSGITSQIEEDLRCYSFGTNPADCIGAEYSQFKSWSNFTSEDAWLVAVAQGSAFPWHTVSDFLGSLIRTETSHFDEGYFFEPFGHLETFTVEDLHKLPARLISTDGTAIASKLHEIISLRLA